MAKLALQLQNVVVVLIFFVFMMNMQYVCGTNKTLCIYRGDQDIFDNPTCEETGGCSDCRAMNAFCNTTDTDLIMTSSGCNKCTCFDQYRTYLPRFGRCVKDDRLLFLPVRKNSSLIQDSLRPSVCITYNRSSILTTANCNPSDSSQQWIRTQHEQLLHTKTSKCIQRGEKYPSLNNTWYLGLEECNTSETKQKWVYHGELLINDFLNSDGQKYLVYITYNTANIIYAKSDGVTPWKLESIGCNKFTNPSSAILVLDTKSQLKGKQQFADISRMGKCIVDNVQFWNYDRNWKPIEFTKKIFSIVRNTMGFKYLKWDLTEAPPSNLILKLYFNCTSQLGPPTAAKTRCVLIKLKYNPYPNYHTTASSSKPPITSPTESFTNEESSTESFTGALNPSPSSPTTNEKLSTESFTGTLNPSPSSPTAKEKLSTESFTGALNPSPSSPTTNEKLSTESFTGALNPSPSSPTAKEKLSTESFTGTLNPSPSSPTTNEKSPTSSRGKQKAESSNVVGIVVGVLVAILVVSGIILGFVCYKRRNRLDKTTSEVQINGKEQLSKETQNPIYSSDEKSKDSFLNDCGVYQEPDGNMNAASATCDVYEPVDDHKDETQQGKKLASSLQEEPEYDYATNDEIRSAAPQRMPLKHINSSANSRENNESENRNDNEEALYHTLEDDAGPVYQTLEDE